MIHNWALDQYCFEFFIKKKYRPNVEQGWRRAWKQRKKWKTRFEFIATWKRLNWKRNVIGCFPTVIYATPHEWWNGSRTIKWFTSSVHCVPVTRQARFVNKQFVINNFRKAKSWNIKREVENVMKFVLSFYRATWDSAHLQKGISCVINSKQLQRQNILSKWRRNFAFRWVACDISFETDNRKICHRRCNLFNLTCLLFLILPNRLHNFCLISIHHVITPCLLPKSRRNLFALMINRRATCGPCPNVNRSRITPCKNVSIKYFSHRESCSRGFNRRVSLRGQISIYKLSQSTQKVFCARNSDLNFEVRLPFCKIRAHNGEEYKKVLVVFFSSFNRLLHVNSMWTEWGQSSERGTNEEFLFFIFVETPKLRSR